MHYKNGRNAQVGDKVLVFNGNHTFIGIVAQTLPGAASCNLYVVPMRETQLTSAIECLHIEDISKAEIPDSRPSLREKARVAPPVDNAHVAAGCEAFTKQAS